MPAATPEAFEWQARARCQDDPAIFFGPDDETGRAREARERNAKAVCARCPVRLRCLLWALGENIRHGVFGGTGEAERANLREAEMRRQRMAEAA